MEQQHHDNFIVVDVQGFFINNKFFAKEVCVSISDFEKQTFHIESTIKYSELSNKDRITNKWLYNHFHGLHWDTGESTLKELIEYLILVMKKRKEEEYPVVYVKGFEKVRWLKELVGGEIEICIINLDYCNCPNIKTLYKNNPNINLCKNHNNFNQICAEKNVILLRNFLNLYLNKENPINQ